MEAFLLEDDLEDDEEFPAKTLIVMIPPGNKAVQFAVLETLASHAPDSEKEMLGYVLASLAVYHYKGERDL